MVRHRNPIGPIALVIGTITLLPVMLVGGVLLGVTRYFGLNGLAAMMAFIYIVTYALWSFFLFLSVDVGPGRVVLRAPLRRITINAYEVDRLELEPPVHTLSTKLEWGKPWSKLVIHVRGRHPIDSSAMPDGLKLRIAHALQPDRFPFPSDPDA